MKKIKEIHFSLCRYREILRILQPEMQLCPPTQAEAEADGPDGSAPVSVQGKWEHSFVDLVGSWQCAAYREHCCVLDELEKKRCGAIPSRHRWTRGGTAVAATETGPSLSKCGEARSGMSRRTRLLCKEHVRIGRGVQGLQWVAVDHAVGRRTRQVPLFRALALAMFLQGRRTNADAPWTFQLQMVVLASQPRWRGGFCEKNNTYPIQLCLEGEYGQSG